MTQRLLHPFWTAVCGAALLSCLPSDPKLQDPSKTGTTTQGPGNTTGGPEGTVDAGVYLSARSYFTQEVLPSLVGTCGGCHRVDNGVGPGFLKSGDPDKYDPYPIVATWPGFIADQPQLSVLLRKGTHEGPALVGADTGCTDQCGLVLEWLKREKVERDATMVTPFSPATKPFYPNLTPGAYTQVDLGQLGDLFTGAYLRFKINLLSVGIEVSDLRIFNRKPGAQANEERTIYMNHPLFVVWLGGMPYPDRTDNFAGYDKAVALNQDDLDANGKPIVGSGVLITPGLFTLTQFRSGGALSVVWDKLQVLPPSKPLPCTTAGLNIFNTQVAQNYLSKSMSCTKSDTGGGCHDTKAAGGINMLAGLLQLGAAADKNAALCATLKFYNAANTIQRNTDPNIPVHPFKWNSTNCTANALPATCFTDFVTVLNNWRSAEQ